MRIGGLCFGYGGLELSVQAVLGGELAWYAEIDSGACKVAAHRFPGVPNLGDMTRVDWGRVEPVDVLTGGTPCQDLSHAGKRGGMSEGTRSNLWVAMRDAIAALRPSLVVWENVRGALSAPADSEVERAEGLLGVGRPGPYLRAAGRVVGDLAGLGYVGGWHGLRASDVGAPHGRWRVFVAAHYARGVGLGHGHAGQPRGATEESGVAAADAAHLGHERVGRPRRRGAGPADGGLLPTPRATDGTKGGPNQRGTSGDLMLPSAVTLLPTPTSQAAKHDADDRGPGTLDDHNLWSVAARLLPTPSVADVEGGRKHRSGERSDELLLNGIAHHQAWGQYAAAITRWEAVLGRPAPPPTQPSRKGTPQLSPRFSEWLMGLPDGWVTDVPGITRNEALRALGNGVVPQQAQAALRYLLALEVPA